MLVRFGYVAIAMNITNGSPNKTVTVKTIEKILDPSARINRLRRILQENLDTTLRILRYNTAHDISVYRFTSKTVPLATHTTSAGWDYIKEFQKEWREIGTYIKKFNIRVSAHPDHYTLLNSPKSEVLAASLRDLDYHVSIFEALELDTTPQLVMHIGGLYKNKQESTQRFLNEFNLLPERIRLRLMLENDDKSYGATDVLKLCLLLNCPMVLDIHHHACLNNGEHLANLWPTILATWGNTIPKIHVSSPKSTTDFRSHADIIKIEDFLPFLKIAKELNKDFDVMIEAKQKDIAMFQLVDELQKIPGIKRVSQAAIEL